MNLIASALNRNAADAAADERRHFFIAVSVLNEYLVGSKDILGSRGEVTVFEETRNVCYFLNARHKMVAVEKIDIDVFGHDYSSSFLE